VRYFPGKAFPPYAFLPGRDPHPTRDPRGHSFGLAEETATYLPAARWRENAPYLWGTDLYNHGFLWEAHEAWEGLWHVAKHDRTLALHVQGLIQCAAAWLKIPMLQPQGTLRLAALALEKLEEVAERNRGAYMGLDLTAFTAAVRAFADSRPATLAGYPRIVLAEP
jgi:hypothetical protein